MTSTRGSRPPLTDPAAPVVRATSLRKVFGGPAGQADVVAVDDVSFALARGESLAVVGESGSGKTTVARMLVGLERPTAGEIEFEGRRREHGRRMPTRARREWARIVQMVFQDSYSSLDPRQTIADGLDEIVGLHEGGAPAARQARVAELLDQVGLFERVGRARPANLSGGQRQRAAIAKALAARPKVLVLDESVSALDVSVQAQVLNLLADIRQATRMSYIFISHDLAVVRQVADRVIVMRGGVVVEEGRTAAVLDRPVDAYTRRLRESVPRPGGRPGAAVAQAE
ncbi:ABC transporter ATP-binding protein [Baekduia sp.]|uniref:ABC transporter ATP-binding protein n=1 Tax=Baekduia sp. TaxID=2600305 RepID=UPI0039C86E6E